MNDFRKLLANRIFKGPSFDAGELPNFLAVTEMILTSVEG